MIRWLIVIFIALLIFGGFSKWLEKMGLGRLPGDFRFRIFGRRIELPFTSAVVLSLIAMGVSKLL